MQKTVTLIYEHNVIQHYSVHYSLKTPVNIKANQPQPHLVKKQFNIFILSLGGSIGGVIGLFISYQLSFNILGYIVLILLPFIMALFLRKIYNQTLLNILHDSQYIQRH